MVKTMLPVQEVCVQSLAEEKRSQMPRGTARTFLKRASPFSQLLSQPFLKPPLLARLSPKTYTVLLLGKDIKQAAWPHGTSCPL